MKVRYIGFDDQLPGTGTDPTKHLTEDRIYEVDRTEVHTWHSLYFLVEFDSLGFNTCCFVPEGPKRCPICKDDFETGDLFCSPKCHGIWLDDGWGRDENQ